MARYLVPLGIFVLLLALFAAGLKINPRTVPSPLIGKPIPHFELPTVKDPSKHISDDTLRGHVVMFNVWASWCVACREEHPFLVKLKKEGALPVPLYGLNYKDARPDALRWLNGLGDPYTVSAFDAEGQVAIDWGVYGVPETFIVDKKGIIRYKQIGPITPDAWNKTLLPLLKKLEAEPA